MLVDTLLDSNKIWSNLCHSPTTLNLDALTKLVYDWFSSFFEVDKCREFHDNPSHIVYCFPKLTLKILDQIWPLKPSPRCYDCISDIALSFSQSQRSTEIYGDVWSQYAQPTTTMHLKGVTALKLFLYEQTSSSWHKMYSFTGILSWIFNARIRQHILSDNDL